MSTKSTPKKPAERAVKATKATAKPKAAAKTAAKPKASAKPAAAAKAPAKPAAAAAKAPAKTAAKAPAKPKAAKPKAKKAAKSAARSEQREAVRPLIKVRQAREFTSKKVTKAELEAITEVARWSGSSRNEQPCRFVAMRNRELIRKVADLGLPQTRGLPTATAAVAIIVPEEPERELSRAFDDGRAAERMLIAAHTLGLGAGISRVRPDVRAGINEVLRLPANRSVRTIVGFGHPTDDALQPKSRPGTARLPREQVIYDERWPEPPAKD